MKPYFVSLDLIIGEFEKQSFHVLKAKDKHDAGTKAIEGECHGDPEWTDEDKQECWDCGQMVYRVYSVEEITPEELEVFKKYRMFY